MTINGTSTEDDFEIIKFVDDNTLFTMLEGKPWIDRDQASETKKKKSWRKRNKS
jgi:hypothetical protein